MEAFIIARIANGSTEVDILISLAVENCPPPKIDLWCRSDFVCLLKSIYRGRPEKEGHFSEADSLHRLPLLIEPDPISNLKPIVARLPVSTIYMK